MAIDPFGAESGCPIEDCGMAAYHQDLVIHCREYDDYPLVI